MTEPIWINEPFWKYAKSNRECPDCGKLFPFLVKVIDKEDGMREKFVCRTKCCLKDRYAMVFAKRKVKKT